MLHNSSLAPWVLGTALLLAPAGAALAQVPVISAVIPMANAVAAGRNGPVAASFSQPLTAASAGALKVFSSQHGGLRTRGATPAVLSGSTLSFAPTAYPFMPGETVQYTVTTAAAGSGGALARARVGQFTAAVGGTGSGNFQAGTDQAVGNGPNTVVLGDVNGDGNLDMLTANSDNDAVAILLNNGRGAFKAYALVPVGRYPFGVVVADVDADGDLDLLAANKRDQTVSIRFNDGSGTFSGTQEVGVGPDPHGLVVGDVDGDGDLDLLTANVFANTVSVRLNDGNGTFNGTYNVGVGPTPQRLTLGDVDGDGDLDLLTANFNTAGTVSIRVNDGHGRFSGAQEASVGTYPYGVLVGDVDNDNDLDLFTFSFVPNGLFSVRFNDGSGHFSGSRDIAAGGFPSGMALGDVDHDGNLDLLVATSWGLNLTTYYNNGAGFYSASPGVGVGLSPYSIALGDVDNDGDLDALVANWTSSNGTVSVRLNGGTGPLATAPSRSAVALALYPNPAHGTTTLTGTTPNAPLTVLDTLGRVLLTATADAAGTARLVLPEGLPAGVYLVHSGKQMRRLAVE